MGTMWFVLPGVDTRAARQAVMAGEKPGGAHRWLTWTSPDRRVVCSVVPHARRYQLLLTEGTRVVALLTFDEWSAASAEAQRLSSIYGGSSPQDDG